MPAPSFFVASATHTSSTKSTDTASPAPQAQGVTVDKAFLTHTMLGMFNHLSAKYNYHPQETASPANQVALINLLQDLSSPLTYPVRDHHGFFSHIWDKLAHPSGKTNPFGKVTGGMGTYRIMERNWQTILWDLSKIICTSVYDPASRQILYNEIQNLVKTASTYQQSAGSDYTVIVKHVLSTEGESPTLGIYWIEVALGDIIYANPFPSMAFNYNYTIFGFDKKKLELIDPQIIPPKSTIEQWAEKLTTPNGPYAPKVCWS